MEGLLTASDEILALLSRLYGAERAGNIAGRVRALIAEYAGRIPRATMRNLDQRDGILIAYPDQVTSNGRPPLAELLAFAEKHLKGIVSAIHLLPFHPWSSDDGFSIIDPRAVAAQYGTWDDVRSLGERFNLMLDAVVNHASAESRWFELFRNRETPYQDYFIRVEGTPDLSAVARPRSTALTSPFATKVGDVAIWTTFGPDQVDFNYRSPDLLIEILDVLLFYAVQGALFLRLDAVAYLWKEIGTPCTNLPQTHTLVQLMRAVVEQAAPQVRLVTETNVPQTDNLAYLGDGTNEAHLIYNFSIAPLVLHGFSAQRSETLAEWLSTFPPPSGQVTFLNMLATHDGIGLEPLRGILPEAEINKLAQTCLERGGMVGYKALGDAGTRPYELNMNYLDALDALGPKVDSDLELERFVTAHAIMLSLPGVPAIYFHSLFGSRGWSDGVISSGQNRRINRQKLSRVRLERELSDPSSLRARVYRSLSRLLRIRAGQPAFSPQAPFEAPFAKGPVLGFWRGREGGNAATLCMYNLGPRPCKVSVPLPEGRSFGSGELRDLISGSRMADAVSGSFELSAYQSLWLTLDAQE